MMLLCLQRLRPDTNVDIYKKIEALKAVTPKDVDLDLPLLLDNLNEKCDEIMDIDAKAYAETQFAADSFRIMTDGAPEAF